jgi:hypothetical protein
MNLFVETLGRRIRMSGSRRNRIVDGAVAGLDRFRHVFIISRHGQLIRMALTDRGVIAVSATDGFPLCGAAGNRTRRS